MKDEGALRPSWDDQGGAGKARDFAEPPREDPPDDDIPMDPPGQEDERGGIEDE